MNGLIEVLILALTQGLTEFLPVSSSGHLVLLQQWFGADEGDLFLDVLLHCGTLGSILVVYRKEIKRLLAFDRAALLYIGSLVIGTLPVVIIGGLFYDQISSLFHAPRLAALGLLLTTAILFSTRFVKASRTQLPEPWQPEAVSPFKAIFIGIAQAMAIVPGISRSGATIATSLWIGLPRADAARFSFLLSIPAICGALVLQLTGEPIVTRGGVVGPVLAVLVSLLVGLLAIKWTALAVIQQHFWKFSFYCILLGILVLVLI